MKLNKCPSCGANIKSGTSKCEYCGSEFVVEDEHENKHDIEFAEDYSINKDDLGLEVLGPEVKDQPDKVESIFKKASWFAIIICWFFMPPLGMILLIGKLLSISSNTNKK